MTAKEIYQILLNGAKEQWQNTCDGLITGEESKVIHKVGTCFKLTAELLEKAIAEKVDMIITHEPTFCCGDRREDANEIDKKKWKMLDDSGITLYRFHDHAHNTEPDYIHEGFIQELDLQIKEKYPRESLGVCRYELAEKITAGELANRIKERLDIPTVRMVGNEDTMLHSICLGLGAVGYVQIHKLFDPGCDAFIAGEVGEVCVDEYVRDAGYFGENKAIFVLGHYTSEYAGMKFLARKMNEGTIPTVFLGGSEVYRYL